MHGECILMFAEPAALFLPSDAPFGVEAAWQAASVKEGKMVEGGTH
jgi:hypothetical protein